MVTEISFIDLELFNLEFYIILFITLILTISNMIRPKVYSLTITDVILFIFFYNIVTQSSISQNDVFLAFIIVIEFLMLGYMIKTKKDDYYSSSD